VAVLFLNTETFHDFFYVAVKRESDCKRVAWELSARHAEFPRAAVRRVLMNNTIVTCNGRGYDIPLLWHAIRGAGNKQLKAASDAIIQERIRWWDVGKFLGITIPRELRHIDLIEVQPSAFASLMALNGRLHGSCLQGLPFEPDTRLTPQQMGQIARYCKISNLDATHSLWDALRDPLALRKNLGRQYKEDFMSRSDAQIGETILINRVRQITGNRPQRVDRKPGTTFRYEPPDWLRFDTPALQAVLERIKANEFVIGKNMKVSLPEWLYQQKVMIGLTTYNMGIGGLHSTEAGRALTSDRERVLVDADVASQYPAIILQLGLYPKSLGKPFLKVYGDIKRERMIAKADAAGIVILAKRDA
jgi:hypothetical protein